MPPLEVGSLHEGIIQEVVFGGYGLIKLEGWVLFVRAAQGVVPGENVEVKIQKRQKNFFWADVTRLIQKSPLRVIPKCPHFGICGGCQLQHLPVEEQSHLKTAWLQNAFTKAFKEETFYKEWIVVPTKQPWNWRRRVFLHAVCSNHQWNWGYYQGDNNSLCQPITCPIFEEGETLWQELQRFFEQLAPTEGQKIEVCVAKVGEGHMALILHVTGALPVNMEELISSFWHYFEARGADRVVRRGTCSIIEQVMGFTINSTPFAFAQNHPDAYENLYGDLVRQLSSSENSLIYDLYSGIGVLSVLLASHGYSVESIEYDALAVQQAKINAKINGFASRIRTHQGRVEEVLPQLQRQVACWVVNPPRSGLTPEVCEAIKERDVQELFYISCHAETLVRDIKNIGMKVIWGRGYDLFPQTTHFETVVHLRRA